MRSLPAVSRALWGTTRGGGAIGPSPNGVAANGRADGSNGHSVARDWSWCYLITVFPGCCPSELWKSPDAVRGGALLLCSSPLEHSAEVRGFLRGGGASWGFL